MRQRARARDPGRSGRFHGVRGSGRSRARPARPGPGRAVPASQALAVAAARAALDKKASGVEVIDVTGKVDYADYLVVAGGQSDRHVAAIAEAVEQALSRAGQRPINVEGLPAARWVLLDFVDVVVHVFQSELRALYDLGGLWMDAERISVNQSS
jgi:ribosome-associated protein